MTRKVAAVVLGFLLIAVMAVGTGCSTEPQTPQKVNSGSDSTGGDTADQPADSEAAGGQSASGDLTTQGSVEIFNVGDVVKIGDIQVTVNDFRTDKGSDFMTPAEGNVYFIVDLTLENLSDEVFSSSSLLSFELADQDGYNYGVTFGPDTKGSLDGDVKANGKIRGEMAFEIPENSSSIELVYDPTLFGDGQVVWNLQGDGAAPLGELKAEAYKQLDSNAVYGVDDKIRSGDVIYTLKGVRTSQGNDIFKPEDGMEYLIFDVQIENYGAEAYTVSSLMSSQVVDAEGYSYDITIGADTKGNLDGELAPGRRMRGEIAFEVPEGQVKELQFKPDMFGNDMIIWNVE